MDKEINSNGFGYVDLELPSGTLWATQNIGASSPEESGLYFQWGDVRGSTKEQIGKGDGQKKFAKDFSDCKFSINGSDTNFSKYTTNGAKLDLEDDAAHVIMGGSWHIPTTEQIWELIENTTATWTKYDKVIGLSFASKRDITKEIFIPAAGYVKDGSIHYIEAESYIWSSMLSKNRVGDGQNLNITTDGINVDENHRGLGFPVRGVIDNNLNLSELIKNEIKNNFKVKVSADYGGYVNVELLYDGEVISSDACQVITDFNSLNE